MKNGSLTIKKINILGSKASELINNNKILLSQISYYQNMFNSNKKYISEYLNIISKFKANTKNSKNISENKSNNKIQMIKDLLIKYNSEIKLSLSLIAFLYKKLSSLIFVFASTKLFIPEINFCL